MTAGQLRDYMIGYCKSHSENDDVMLYDESEASDSCYDVHATMATSIIRTATKAKFETRKVISTNNAYCKHCRNFVEGSRKFNGCIDCNNPRSGKVISNVLEYCGSPCMDYNPFHPIYIDKEVEVEPARYKKVKIAALMFNKNEEVE